MYYESKPEKFHLMLNSDNRENNGSGTSNSDCTFTIPNLSQIGPSFKKAQLVVERFHVQSVTTTYATNFINTTAVNYTRNASDDSDGNPQLGDVIPAAGGAHAFTTFPQYYATPLQGDTIESTCLLLDLPQLNTFDAITRGGSKIIAMNGADSNPQGSYTTSQVPLQPICLAVTSGIFDTPLRFSLRKLHMASSTSGTTTFEALDREWSAYITLMLWKD